MHFKMFMMMTIRYGQATCQNHHVIYEAFATVLLRGWASHSYLFRRELYFRRRSTVYTHCNVTSESLDPEMPLLTHRSSPSVTLS